MNDYLNSITHTHGLVHLDSVDINLVEKMRSHTNSCGKTTIFFIKLTRLRHEKSSSTSIITRSLQDFDINIFECRVGS